MATSRDSIEMRLKLARAREFQRGVNKSARSVDNLGDQASQAARKMSKLNAASSKTRVNIGPFSTSMRFAAVGVGGLMMATRSAIPLVLSLGEAIATVSTGAGAAGLVWLTAFGQASVVAKLGLSDLTDALGGNEAALKRLGPEAEKLFKTLNEAKNGFRVRTNASLLPGLEEGATSALKNLPIINTLVTDTSATIGNLGREAGGKLGSKLWGDDIRDMGQTNIRIIDNLGHAGLNLADVFRNVLHEAGPLAEDLSQMALRGSELASAWIANQRATGGLSRFFSRAKTDIHLLISATGHLAGGVLNLFGHQDVDGTNTLRNLDRLMARFQRWTASVSGDPLGPELQRQMERGLGAAASFLGAHIGEAGATAAGAFGKAFMSASWAGKGITALWLLSKFGLTKGIIGGAAKLLGRGIAGGAAGGAAGKLMAKGGSPANPLFVSVVGPGALPGGIPPVAAGGGALITAGAAGLIGLAIAGAVYAAMLPTTAPGKTRNLRRKNFNDPVSEHGPAAPTDSPGMRSWRRDAGLSGPNATQVPRGTPGLSPVPVNVNSTTTINLDGKPIYHSTRRQVAKHGARRKQRATGVAAFIPGFGGN